MKLFLKGKTMKSGMMAILMLAAVFNLALGAEQTTIIDANETEEEIVVQLPPKGGAEYWNVRSEAISEFLPLLTKKRTEMKKNQQLLSDYLLGIGKASEFASKNVPVPTNPNVYFEILQIHQALPGLDTSKITKRPSWDELMELVMGHVLTEGYLPTDVEEGDDLAQYIQVCRKKEEYGQKVRQEMRLALDQCARMWVYLDSIEQKDKFKTYYADLKLSEKAQKEAEKDAMLEQKRQTTIARAQQQEQQKAEDAIAREQFQSSKKQNAYDDRQARLQHSQSMLDQRFVNGGGYN
jgi:hypothetical protein